MGDIPSQDFIHSAKEDGDIPGLYTEISIDRNIYNDEIMGKIEDRSIINNINKKLSESEWTIRDGRTDGVIFENIRIK